MQPYFIIFYVRSELFEKILKFYVYLAILFYIYHLTFSKFI